MTCQEAQPLLQIYLDSELDAIDARPIAEHLRGCARCRAELETYRRGDALMRNAIAAKPGASEVLRERVRRATAPSKHLFFQRLALAAALVAVTLGGFAVYRIVSTSYDPAHDLYRQKAIAEHARAAAAAPSDGQPVHTEEVTPLVAETTGGQVRDTGIPGFRIVSGHPCRIDERTFAHLVYRSSAGHTISVYLCVADGALPRGQESLETAAGRVEIATLDGRTAAIADIGGVRRIVVGDAVDRDQIIAAALAFT